MIAVAQAKIFVDDRAFAIVPTLGEKGYGLTIRNCQKNVIGVARDVNTLTLVHVYEVFFTGLDIHLHLHSGSIHQHDVFIKLGVAMIAPDFAGFDKLMRPLHDGLGRHKGKDGAPAITDRA